MTIRRHLIISFVAIVLLFAVNVAVYFWGSGQRQAGFDDLQRAMRREQLILRIEKALSDVEKQVALVSQGLVAPTGAAPGTALPGAKDALAFSGQLKTIGDRVAEFINLTPPEGRDAANEFGGAVNQLRASWYLFLLNSSANQPAAIMELAIRAEPLSREVLGVRLPRLSATEQAATERAKLNFRSVAHLADQATMGTFLLSIALAIVFGYAVSRRLTLGLSALKAGAAAIGSGDLEHLITLNSKDELGDLARAFNEMTGNLRVTEQLKSRVSEAEEASRLKSEFLATMSHEIRTPMNGVLGMTGFLLDTDLDEEQREFAETVAESANALMTIINDILDYSKIEAGKISLEVLEFNLVEVVESAVNLIAEPAHQKGIELACWIDPDVPRNVRGDPGRLRQILLNLIGNAVKFTSRGEVVVRVAQLDSSGNRAEIKFSIQDTGIGVPEAACARLFQPFTQADGSTTRKYGGTGLGLAICKQLVERLGGKIGFSSVLREGSLFWFTMPFERGLGGETGIPSSHPGDLKGVHTLIVDDNATNRDILDRYLHSWNARGEMAASGSEALHLLRLRAQAADPFTLVILDLQMPDMDGLSLAAVIEADPQISQASIVLLSSIFVKEDALALSQAKLAARLTKPVRKEELLHALESVLAHQGSSGPAPLGRSVTNTRKDIRILVAEDNSANQRVVLQLLKSLGYSADAVANGFEVLENLQRIPYDLVLMDCGMPEMDGFEATQRIRLLPDDRSRLPIVGMTANDHEKERGASLPAGMDAYLTKPVNPQLLAATLEHWARPRLAV